MRPFCRSIRPGYFPITMLRPTFSDADELNSTKLPNSYVSGVIIDSCNLFRQPGAFIHPLKQISNSVDERTGA
jgi:hypothetical protein